MPNSTLCLFSGLAGANAGGIQNSGRLAWQALTDHAPAELIASGPVEADDLSLATRSPVIQESGGRLAARVFRQRWQAQQILVWHVGLLQLLPFIRPGGKRVVLFLHGIEVWRKLPWWTRRLLNRVDLFLSNSDFTWKRFVEFQPQCAVRPHRIVPLGWGQPVATVPPCDAAPVVLMLSRLARGEDYKGHREIISAWSAVRTLFPDAQLWIAGDGDLRPILEQMVAPGERSHVRFWGRASEAQKIELLGRCRCFAMPSRGEGFGIVYAEAMRLGRPCLVSTQDAGREVINAPEAGLAVDPGDQAALVQALCRLLDDGHEWQEMSRAARARYEMLYTAEKFQNRLIEALA